MEHIQFVLLGWGGDEQMNFLQFANSVHVHDEENGREPGKTQQFNGYSNLTRFRIVLFHLRELHI